jgi:hypothetical protein
MAGTVQECLVGMHSSEEQLGCPTQKKNTPSKIFGAIQLKPSMLQ